MYRNGAKSYKQTEVITADPKRLVIICYQGAIDNLKIAIQRHSERQFEAKAKAVGKAESFLNELMHSLDFERGGEIAKNLDSLYNYMVRRILYAETSRTIEPVEEVIGMLEDLKEGWEEIFFGAKKVPAETDNELPYVAESMDRKNPQQSAARG